MLFELKEKFHLSPRFIDKYKDKQPCWGPIGYITYKRSYARTMVEYNGKTYDRSEFSKQFKNDDDLITSNKAIERSEEYWETVKRVVEGCYSVQLTHCRSLKLPWNAHKAQKSAQEMYELMWNFKFLPPGRGLWAMGAPVLYEKGSACLCNCAFVSTNQIGTSFSEPFCFLMDMSLVGVGVSFDTQGKGLVEIKSPKVGEYTYVVEDSREGWVDLIRVILESFVGNAMLPKNIDYSKIRKQGSPIKTFGGIAPGPDPLILCVTEIKEVLSKKIDEKIDSVTIVDLMNIIGKAVVAGGIRRTAELALGEPDDNEYLKLKDPIMYGNELKLWRWASNNSISSYIGMNYDDISIQTSINGEPGFFWMENAQKYGRMCDGVTWSDKLATGTNPCGEQTLESFEICNLVETFPSRHETFDEFKRTLKFAYLYAKTVTLIPTHNERTNQIMLRNRRIGLSQSGITEAFEKFGRRNFLNMCNEGYLYITELDKKYSGWLCIPVSNKKTTVKPSGTVSLLPGITPGIHYPHSEYYLRSIRITKGSPIVDICKNAGYVSEDSVYGDNSVVVYFPVKTENFGRSKNDVSMWEQLENAAAIQNVWSDNQVSITVTFQDNEAKDISRALELYETRLKAVSFLPVSDHKYEQAPYTEITESQYNEYVSKIKPLDFSSGPHHEVDEKYCTSETCELKIQDI